jgi:hypothetical protein
MAIYVSELEKRAEESCTYGAVGRNDGKGAHSTGCIADTLAARHILWKVWR